MYVGGWTGDQLTQVEHRACRSVIMQVTTPHSMCIAEAIGKSRSGLQQHLWGLIAPLQTRATRHASSPPVVRVSKSTAVHPTLVGSHSLR